MYAIYGNIYHQYTPNVSIYTSTMDPMGLWNPRYVAIGIHPVTWQTDSRPTGQTQTARRRTW